MVDYRLQQPNRQALLRSLRTRPFYMICKIKHASKERASAFLRKDSGIIVNPDTMFDVQVKRIHEYKRQLLNALNILLIYDDIKAGGKLTKDMKPMTFLFGGKAAPGYVNAKLIIKLINNIAKVINADGAKQTNSSPSISCPIIGLPWLKASYLQQICLSNFNSRKPKPPEQGNMKFMCNGALTIGTMDGAN